jgi:hypothetical protein
LLVHRYFANYFYTLVGNIGAFASFQRGTGRGESTLSSGGSPLSGAGSLPHLPQLKSGHSAIENSSDKGAPSGPAYRILYAILAISFSLSLAFVIFFKFDLESDWMLVLLLLISFVSGVYGFGVLLDSFLEGGELIRHVSQVGDDYLTGGVGVGQFRVLGRKSVSMYCTRMCTGYVAQISDQSAALSQCRGIGGGVSASNFLVIAFRSSFPGLAPKCSS